MNIVAHLGESDTDWFRIEVPPGQVLEAEVISGPFWHRIELRSDTGELFASKARQDPLDPAPVVSGGSKTGAVRLGLWGDLCCSDEDYEIRITVAPGVDAVVSNVRVEDRPRTLLGSPPVPPAEKDVVAAVTNLGLVPADSLLVESWVVPKDSPGASKRFLPSRWVEVPPGASQEVRIPWDTLGQVGDFEVHIRAVEEEDADPVDNEATARAWVLATGLGVGFDATNHRLAATGPSSSLTLESARDAQGPHAYADAWVLPASLTVSYGRGPIYVEPCSRYPYGFCI